MSTEKLTFKTFPIASMNELNLIGIGKYFMTPYLTREAILAFSIAGPERIIGMFFALGSEILIFNDRD